MTTLLSAATVVAVITGMAAATLVLIRLGDRRWARRVRLARAEHRRGGRR